MFEFNARISSRKAPLDGDLLLIAPARPGSDMPLSHVQGDILSQINKVAVGLLRAGRII